MTKIIVLRTVLFLLSFLASQPVYAAQTLTPDDIIKLKEAGVSDEVILEMIKRGKEVEKSGKEKQEQRRPTWTLEGIGELVKFRSVLDNARDVMSQRKGGDTEIGSGLTKSGLFMYFRWDGSATITTFEEKSSPRLGTKPNSVITHTFRD